MNRHFMRIVWLLLGWSIALAWWMWRAWDEPSDEALVADFLTASAGAIAWMIVLAWGSWHDFRTQGISPKGVMGTDRRGRAVVLDYLSAYAALARLGVPKVVRKQWLRANPRPALNWKPLVSGLVAYAIGLAAALLILPNAWMFWSWIAVFLLFALSMLFLLRYSMMRLAAHMSFEAAGFGICGSCAYDMRALDEQEDGCTVCPECGAAWRIAMRPRPESTATGDLMNPPDAHQPAADAGLVRQDSQSQLRSDHP